MLFLLLSRFVGRIVMCVSPSNLRIREHSFFRDHHIRGTPTVKRHREVWPPQRPAQRAG